jgi:hypothetical protein
MVLSVVAVGATPAAAQAAEEVNVVLEPTEQQAQPGGEITYDVVVEGAADGVSAYEATVEIADTDVAEITDVEDANADRGVGDATIADDGSSVSFNRGLLGDPIRDSDFTVATVTVSAADAEGDTTLSVNDAQFNNADGATYANNELGSADLTVAAADGGAGDVNIVLEPTAQEIQPGGETTYDITIKGAKNDISAHTATIEIADPSVAEITEFEDAFADRGVGSVDIANDGSSVSFQRGVVGADNIPGPNTTIGTMTVSAADAEGETTLSVSEAQVKDADDATYGNNELGSATVSVVEQELPDFGDNGEPPKDPNGDGFREDINGDGNVNIFDITALWDVIG